MDTLRCFHSDVPSLLGLLSVRNVCIQSSVDFTLGKFVSPPPQSRHQQEDPSCHLFNQTYQSPSPPFLTPAITRLLSISKTQKRHRNGIIQYVIFGDCLFSLSRIPWRCVQVVGVLGHSTVVHSSGWLTSLFSHSPVEGHLGCFQLGDIMNKGAIDVPCTGFCVNIGFHFPRIQVPQCTGWVVD